MKKPTSHNLWPQIDSVINSVINSKIARSAVSKNSAERSVFYAAPATKFIKVALVALGNRSLRDCIIYLML